MGARIVVEASEQEVFPKVSGVSASNKFLTRRLKVRWRSYGALAPSGKRPNAREDHWFVATADERELIPTGSYASFLVVFRREKLPKS